MTSAKTGRGLIPPSHLWRSSWTLFAKTKASFLEVATGREMSSYMNRTERITASLVGISVCVLGGCGTTDNQEQLSHPAPRPAQMHSQPAPQPLETYVGGTIFKVDRTK